MDNTVLLLWLYGPMQSWGTMRSRWDPRDTGLEPTKSGIIGLLGCALGIARGAPELIALDGSLRFGVRVDRQGVVATDYHTVTGYHRTAAGEFKHSGGTAKSLTKAHEHDEATIVSPREYLFDAVFLAALEGDADIIPRLTAAVTEPQWPIYLGRKSCPPCYPLVDHDSNRFASLEQALQERARHMRAEQKGTLAAFTEVTDNAAISSDDHIYERQDRVQLGTLRMYGFRKCRYLEVDPPCFSPA